MTSIRRRIELPVAADRADDGLERAGRSVHVEPHLHQLRNHALDLFVVRAFLHHHNHKILDCFKSLAGRPPLDDRFRDNMTRRYLSTGSVRVHPANLLPRCARGASLHR